MNKLEKLQFTQPISYYESKAIYIDSQGQNFLIHLISHNPKALGKFMNNISASFELVLESENLDNIPLSQCDSNLEEEIENNLDNNIEFLIGIPETSINKPQTFEWELDNIFNNNINSNLIIKPLRIIDNNDPSFSTLPRNTSNINVSISVPSGSAKISLQQNINNIWRTITSINCSSNDCKLEHQENGLFRLFVEKTSTLANVRITGTWTVT